MLSDSIMDVTLENITDLEISDAAKLMYSNAADVINIESKPVDINKKPFHFNLLGLA